MQEVDGSIPSSSTNLAVMIATDTPDGGSRQKALSPSSRGLGHRPFTAATGVRVPEGTPCPAVMREHCESGDVKSGAIAQLGERLHGMQEVDGSIPSSSTNFHALRHCRIVSKVSSPSSSGLGHRPVTAVTGVRVP